MEHIDTLSQFADSIYEASSLKNIRRAHMQTLVGTNPGDTIAAHCQLVGVIGWILAELAGVDPFKVCCMGLFHDFDEARSGDQNWLNKRYVIVDAEKIHEEQYSAFGATSPLSALMAEYTKRESVEAKLPKDGDLLAQVVLLREYAYQGNKEAERQLAGKMEDNSRYLTEEGKLLNTALYKREPYEWWSPLWQKERRTE